MYSSRRLGADSRLCRLRYRNAASSCARARASAADALSMSSSVAPCLPCLDDLVEGAIAGVFASLASFAAGASVGGAALGSAAGCADGGGAAGALDAVWWATATGGVGLGVAGAA